MRSPVLFLLTGILGASTAYARINRHISVANLPEDGAQGVPAIAHSSQYSLPPDWWRLGPNGSSVPTPVTITAGMAADSDGAPSSEVGDKKNHQSQTSLMLKDGPVNAANVCYVVLPLKDGWKHADTLKDVKLGDYCKVTYQGKSQIAVAADKGPANKNHFGEGSLKCLREFGVKTNGNTGIDGGVTYEFYPGSGGGEKPSGEGAMLAGMQAFADKVGTSIATIPGSRTQAER